MNRQELTEAYENGYLTDAQYAEALVALGARKRRIAERREADKAYAERDPINWF